MPGRAAAVFAAITLLLNPEVSRRKHGAEVQLLAYGAKLDVIGARLRRLHPDGVRSVHTRYPRDEFVASFISHIANPQHLDGCTDFLAGIGFEHRAHTNPLDSLRFNQPTPELSSQLRENAS